MLTDEKGSLCASDMQYGFKQGSIMSLCTAMVHESISYYFHNGSNVYGLKLDASKAFDHAKYCKLFRILLEKKVYIYIITNHLSLVICLVISLSLGWWKMIHCHPKQSDMPYRSPDDGSFVFISYYLISLGHLQLMYMR